jgi:hypothetical protein
MRCGDRLAVHLTDTTRHGRRCRCGKPSLRGVYNARIDVESPLGFADRLELAGKVVESVTAPVYRRIGRAYRIGVNA